LSDNLREPVFVGDGTDRYGIERGLGITRLCYKVATADTNGQLFVIEQTMLAKGGPPRHVHFDQDEWFFPLDGEFLVEIGNTQYQLHPGDSLLAPRLVPHVWAYVGNGIGKMMIGFSPAGKMEAFFDLTAQKNSMPSQEPQFWLDHGMRVLGPPLTMELSG
jgi:quercetin dioxygenase-like cupin family protein